MNTNRRALKASYYNGKIYAFGGYNGIFLKDIESAKINPDGSLSEWENEGRQRNYAYSLAEGDYILSLDSDERVTPELKEEILMSLLRWLIQA